MPPKKTKLVPGQAKIDLAFWGRNVKCDAPVQVSITHWQPRRNKNGVKQPDGYDLEAPLYSSNRNNFECFMKIFARSKKPGEWTREECTENGLKLYKSLQQDACIKRNL